MLEIAKIPRKLAEYEEINNPSGVKIHQGANNLFATDPKFIGSSIDSTNPYLIYGISPCVDTGNDSDAYTGNDIRGTGFARQLKKEDGTAGTIDMGAYEYKYSVDYYAPISFNAKGGTDVTEIKPRYMTERLVRLQHQPKTDSALEDGIRKKNAAMNGCLQRYSN